MYLIKYLAITIYFRLCRINYYHTIDISINFRRKASVSEMLHNLGWQSLDSLRQDQRLVLFYKILNGLASVETEDGHPHVS